MPMTTDKNEGYDMLEVRTTIEQEIDQISQKKEAV